MKKIYFILLLLISSFVSVHAQNLKTYQFYNQKGQAVNFGQVVKKLSTYDIVLFGEHHNNSINHWLQLQLTKYLFETKKGKLTLGAEMFERDN